MVRPISVSVLFSEPKIPQYNGMLIYQASGSCFSALQRAENSSMKSYIQLSAAGATFQCSSASRKFLNRASTSEIKHVDERFSALQRAENSSIRVQDRSSGSRSRFSALQRAENSSMQPFSNAPNWRPQFQCSSASRKFLNSGRWSRRSKLVNVSVLFSEPKIPQCAMTPVAVASVLRFQCSSASRKFLNT